MLGEKFGHFCLNRLRQQGTRSIAQHLGERIGERPWLKQLDHVSIGHGVSLLCWRSGGSNTPTIRRLLPVRPSPTSANSSTRKWKTHYWATQRAYAQGQLDYLRKGQIQLTGKDGRDHLADQIGQHERDLAFANDRLEEVRSD